MATTLAVLVAGIVLVFAGSDTAFVAPLTPGWSKPLGKGVRLVGVEEYGRCILFAGNGAIQVVLPSGETMWSWPYSKISRYINPRAVAVSHDCDAIALVGDASYKYAWIAQRGGKAVSIPFTVTPTEAAFDRTGQLVAIGTYGGALHLYARSGDLQWTRDAMVAIVDQLDFTDDNQRVVFKGWGGAGVVSVAGHVEWSGLSNRLAASQDLSTFVFSNEPNHGPGLPQIVVTDASRTTLWSRWAQLDTFISSSGHRVLAGVDANQAKQERDFFGESQEAIVQLLDRDGHVVASYSEYVAPLALSDDGTRAWLRGADHLACVDDRGEVLARIDVEIASNSRAVVSRDFSQVLVVRDRDLDPVSVERYEVPKPCRP